MKAFLDHADATNNMVKITCILLIYEYMKDVFIAEYFDGEKRH